MSALDNVRQQAQEAYDSVWDLADYGRQKLGTFVGEAYYWFTLPFTFMIALFWGGTAFMLASLPAIAVWAVAEILAPVGLRIVQIIGEVRKKNYPEINAISIEVLGELLGSGYTASELPRDMSEAARLDRAAAVGALLHNQLLQEFSQGGTLTPEQGEKAAQMFSGIVCNFGVGSAIISILGETLSLGQLNEFRELGVEVSRNLGIGRLHRAALRPVVDVMISQPYEWQLNQRYRPKLLGPGAAIKAWFRGVYTEEAMRREMIYAGYSDERITALIEDARSGVGDNDLSRLVRWNALERQDAVERLKKKGYTGEQADWLLLNNEYSRLDALEDAAMSIAESQVLDGTLSLADYRAMLDERHFSEPEKLIMVRNLGQRLEYPRKKLSLTQVRDCMVEDIFTKSDLDDWLSSQGYSGADRTALAQLVLTEVSAELKRRADAAAKAAKPKERDLGLHELRRAYFDAIITLAEFQDRATALGFAPDEVDILTLQLLIDAAALAEKKAQAEERERLRQERAGKTPSP